MATSTEIKQRANTLADKTDVNSITPKEVGGIMYDLASHGENVLRNGGTLGIRKVYESVAAMEADSTNPKDFWGDPIKKGNLVVIYDGTTTGVDNNKIYAFMKPGWELATKLDAAYATKAETDAKLAELGSEVIGMRYPDEYKITTQTNLLNMEDEDFVEGYYLDAKGELTEASGFATSGYIVLSKVVSNLILSRKGEVENISGGFIAYYDINKVLVSTKAMTESAVATWFEGVAYVRFSVARYTGGENQVSIGTTPSKYMPYGDSLLCKDISVTTENIKDLSVTNEKVAFKSIKPNNLTILRQNLFNENDENYLPSSFFSDSKGTIGTSNNFAISGYIPFEGGQLILSVNGVVDEGNGGFNIYYNKNKEIIGGENNVTAKQIATWFEGVAYVRFSVARPNRGNILIEQGTEVQDYIPYSETPTIDVRYLHETIPADKSVTDEKLSKEFSAKKTLNLICRDDLLKDMSAYISNGEIKYTTVSTLAATDFIEVKPLTTYTFWYSGNYFFLDADRKPIGEKNDATGAVTVTTPENCKYMVINFYYERTSMGLFELDATARMYEGDILYPYIPYGVNADTLITHLQHQSISLLGNKTTILQRVGVNANTNYTTNSIDYPQSIKNNQIVFSGEFESFSSLIIGRGISNNAYSGSRFEITTEQIILSKNDGGWQQMGSVNHGLTINSYIKVLIGERNKKVLVAVQTLGGLFEHEFDYWGANGLIAYKSDSAMSNTTLSMSNPTFRSPAWMFGDSYYGIDYESRQFYWLRKWGYDNVLIQAFGGQNSNDAYQDLLRCLNFGTPKYIVWSLGMNDDNSEDMSDITTGIWYKTYQKVRKICEVMSITLILTTIPEVRNSSYKNKDKMSEVVRNSGLRYIDVAKAVGSNAQGQWYGEGTEYDYQSTDNVHPSKYGAQAIATQFLADFPELMQY